MRYQKIMYALVLHCIFLNAADAEMLQKVVQHYNELLQQQRELVGQRATCLLEEQEQLDKKIELHKELLAAARENVHFIHLAILPPDKMPEGSKKK